MVVVELHPPSRPVYACMGGLDCVANYISFFPQATVLVISPLGDVQSREQIIQHILLANGSRCYACCHEQSLWSDEDS